MARVLFVHEYPGGFGGAERYLEILARGLRGRGIDVRAVIFAADVASADRLAGALRASGALVDVVAGRSRPGPIRAAVRAQRPDVIHWNAVDPFAFRGGTLSLIPWGPPAVVTDHLPMLRAGVHWETTRRLVNRRAAAVIVVGRAGADAARAHWPALARLVVIRNGVESPTERVAAAAATSAPPRLLFLGRLTTQKDPCFAVDVTAAVRADGVPAVLDVVGDGPEAGGVTERARALGIADAVTVSAGVADVAAALAGAAALLAPSVYEGLPFTPLEALAAGVPAVLSDIPPHREIAEAGPGVIVVARGAVDAWSTAVRSILDDGPGWRARAIEHAGGFTAARMVEETLAVYERAAG